MDTAPISTKKIATGVIIAILAVITLAFSGKIFENVDANEIMVIQSPLAGRLTWYTAAGIKPQWFGRTTNYTKRDIYRISVPVRFNDGGHGTLHGSIQYELPLDSVHLTAIHVTYGSRAAIQQQLVQTVANKAVYMTGPLMSSKESYAERRNDLIRYVEDQVQNGVYRTRTKEVKIRDPISGTEKTVAVVEIVAGENGMPERQESSVLGTFGIKTFNFAIDSLPYDVTVETQIQQQQQLAMQVQTAIAEARQSEQRAITAQKNGEANAATARWEQEVVRAKAVTQAQQQLDVARLDAQSAEQFRRAEILRGEGEGARRRLAMQADGALDKKLEAWIKVNQFYATAIQGYAGAWVPNVVMGGNGSGLAGSGANALIDLLTAKTARDLGLDLSNRVRAPAGN
jgi:hypothetical protein